MLDIWFPVNFAGQGVCERKLEVHRQWHHFQDLSNSQTVFHLPEDDFGGSRGVLQQAGYLYSGQIKPRSHCRRGSASQPRPQQVSHEQDEKISYFGVHKNTKRVSGLLTKLSR